MRSQLKRNWDRVSAIVCVALGLLALVIGWFGVSGTGLAAEQNPYLASGGLGGIALIAVGCTLWVSADLQDQWRRLDAIERILDGSGASTSGAGSAADPATDAEDAHDVAETLVS